MAATEEEIRNSDTKLELPREPIPAIQMGGSAARDSGPNFKSTQPAGTTVLANEDHGDVVDRDCTAHISELEVSIPAIHHVIGTLTKPRSAATGMTVTQLFQQVIGMNACLPILSYLFQRH
jgi:hypothetical protein